MICGLLAGMALGGCRGNGEKRQADKTLEKAHEKRAAGSSGISSSESLNLIRHHFTADTPDYWTEEKTTTVLASLDRADLMKIMEEVTRLKPLGRDGGFLNASMLKLIDQGITDDQLFGWIQSASERDGLISSLGRALGMRARKNFPKFRARFESEWQRNNLTSSFYSAFSGQQPVEAMEAVLSFGGSKETISSNLASVINSMPADTDFEKIGGLISNPSKFPASGDYGQTLYWFLDRWSSYHPSAVADFAWEGRGGSGGFLAMITEDWANADPQPARNWLAQHEEVSNRFDDAISGFITARAEYDPGQCEELASRIGNPERRRRSYETLFESWSEYQPEEAAAARQAWLSRQ